MIHKTVKIVFLKDNYSELKPGMICYSKSSDSFFKDYYRLTEYSDLTNEQAKEAYDYLVGASRGVKFNVLSKLKTQLNYVVKYNCVFFQL